MIALLDRVIRTALSSYLLSLSSSFTKKSLFLFFLLFCKMFSYNANFLFLVPLNLRFLNMADFLWNFTCRCVCMHIPSYEFSNVIYFLNYPFMCLGPIFFKSQNLIERLWNLRKPTQKLFFILTLFKITFPCECYLI